MVSFLCIIRLIFPKCVNNRNARAIIENKKTSISVSLKIYPYRHNDVNETAKAMEASDEIFITFATIAQIMMEIDANKGEATTNIPADVATPFPPLNLNQMGNTCPIRQQNATIKYCEFPSISLVTNASTIPFKPSTNRVINAKILCPLLKTFVAPVLCEPTHLTSTPPKNLVSKKPVGMEPTRYPKMHSKSKFIFTCLKRYQRA